MIGSRLHFASSLCTGNVSQAGDTREHGKDSSNLTLEFLGMDTDPLTVGCIIPSDRISLILSIIHE